MRKMLKLLVLMLTATLIVGLAGCSTDPDDGKDDEKEKESDVSFESFSPPSIYVDNKSGERLIAFKGSLNPNYLISGIPAYATNHGLYKKASIFSQTGDFALILITEAEYNNNKSNVGAATIFAEIYAFYNHEATNNNRFQISSKSGGTGRITLNNPTNWNIEIRRDGPTGEVLGYVASQMTNTVLRVFAPDDYSLYPVFKRYLPADKEIYEVVPTYNSGNYPNLPYAKDITLTTANGTTSWNLGELSTLVGTTLSSGSFYLRIQNSSQTSIRFTRGDDEQITSMGVRGIPAGQTNVYSVKITRNPDKTYPSQVQSADGELKIGTPQIPNDVPAHTYKLDYIYTVRVTGNNAASLVIGDIEESAEPMDFEAMFGRQ
jgi:hypothetical protein